MSKSHAGEIFRLIQEEIGDCTDFIIFYKKNPQMKEEIFQYSHAEHDAMTAFIDVLKRKELYRPEAMPKLPVTERPPLAYILWRFFLKSLKLKIKSDIFQSYNDKRMVNTLDIPTARHTLSFSFDETRKVDEYCKKNKISLMSFFLHHLDQEVQQIVKNPQSRTWMVPITLRSKADQDVKKGDDPLMTGFMDIELPAENPKALASRIKSELLKASHWVGFYAFGLSRFTGTYLLRPLVRLQGKWQFRTGNFSYIGRWGDESIKNEEIFGGYPPVTRNQPVSAIALHWNGRLILNFMMHPFVSQDSKDAEKIVNGWKERLLSSV
jgi:hypothetical protein